MSRQKGSKNKVKSTKIELCKDVTLETKEEVKVDNNIQAESTPIQA